MSRFPMTPASPVPAQLSVDQMRRGILRLQKRLEVVQAFDPNVSNEEHARQITRTLEVSIEEALTQTFGTDSIEYKRYRRAASFHWPINMSRPTPLHDIREALRSDKARSIDLLQAAIDALNERIGEAGEILPNVDLIKTDRLLNREVFIVHGHDDGPKQAVARFLEKTGFHPIILSEQANQGRTIIEKFEAHAQVGFAVVLLTPDDVGGPKGGENQPRARQNVIFELGYFIGKLSRSRVCALLAQDVDIPSDILGVVWIRLDGGGGWKSELAKELQAAGYQLDWNKVMGP